MRPPSQHQIYNPPQCTHKIYIYKPNDRFLIHVLFFSFLVSLFRYYDCSAVSPVSANGNRTANVSVNSTTPTTTTTKSIVINNISHRNAITANTNNINNNNNSSSVNNNNVNPATATLQQKILNENVATSAPPVVVKKSRPKTTSPTRHGPQQCQVCAFRL